MIKIDNLPINYSIILDDLKTKVVEPEKVSIKTHSFEENKLVVRPAPSRPINTLINVK